MTRAAAALASSASLSASMVASPHRFVVFISVVGCGIRSPSGTRQKRRHDNESPASRTTASNDNP
jgi:hypothetical protein